MRVGIVALLQESNTFLRGRTTLAHFEQDMLLTGEPIRERFAGAHHEVAGFFAGLVDAKIEAVPIFAARALPFGTVTRETFDSLMSQLDVALDAAGPLDGLLVAPHGATVSEAAADVDGHWLAKLRHRFPRLPIIGTLDLHANVSQAMVDACDSLIAYRTNPHLDQFQRGVDAARLIARTLRGEVRPVTAAVLLPLAVNIERQLTAEPPCRELYEVADRMLRESGVLTNSVVLGFPYADVPEMGAAVLVTTDGDRDLAKRKAEVLASFWWERRTRFDGKLIPMDDAVSLAAMSPGPICLLDMGDNVGGGSPGDGTLIAHALHQRRVGPAFVCINDPESVQEAIRSGVGAIVHLKVGGKSDDLHGPPLEASFVVRCVTEGKFAETQPRHGGIQKFDQGPTAVVECEGLTVMLTSKRMVPFSLMQLTHAGIEPERFQVLVAKGVHAPVAAYAPVCRRLIRVNTPGVTTADLSLLPYRQRRRPMFPFECDTAWNTASKD
jgi:microcystin degradation protein MlrC